MRVKIFTGQNTKQALDKVKAELGLDAVILGSKEVIKDGQRMVEVTAGTDKDPIQATSKQNMPAGWEDWHKEWDKLKGHIYSLMQPAMQWEKLTPNQRVALEYFQKEGVNQEVIVEFYNALVKNNEEKINQKMLAVMASFVPVKTFNTQNFPQKINIMAGPYGSGKTSVALRLAMLRKAEKHDMSIGFINTDVLRGNGRLVLRYWADLSGFPYFEAPDAEAMEAALAACKSLNCIFIDMEGISRNSTLTQRLDYFGLNKLQAYVHLVLSPAYNNLSEILKRYKTDFPSDIIWTKVDELNHYSELINTAVKSNLPISAISFGAELQGTLLPAEESQIWKLILKHQLPKAN